METTLVIDTETTGFKKAGVLRQPGQARICQIAMILANHKGDIINVFCSLIKPDGWTISEGAKAVHGITDEACNKYGIPMLTVLDVFRQMTFKADLVVAHNMNFDEGMIQIEAEYGFWKLPEYRTFCTMETNKHIAAGRWPKLDVAYQHYCGKSLGDKAHDALNDAIACKEILFAMRGIR